MAESGCPGMCPGMQTLVNLVQGLIVQQHHSPELHKVSADGHDSAAQTWRDEALKARNELAAQEKELHKLVFALVPEEYGEALARDEEEVVNWTFEQLAHFIREQTLTKIRRLISSHYGRQQAEQVERQEEGA